MNWRAHYEAGLTTITSSDIKSFFYPLSVEQDDFSGQYTITASTGKYRAHVIITKRLLKSVDDIKRFKETVEKHLHHHITMQVLEEFYATQNEENIIVDMYAPKTHDITIMHPERYVEHLKRAK